MMQMFKSATVLATVGFVLGGLSACSSNPAEPTSPSSPTATESPTPTPSATESEQPQTETPTDCLTQEEAVAVFEETESRTSAGLTERYLLVDGSEWVLILNPDQEDDYTAAWFNAETGEGELVYDGLTFSYLFGLVALSQNPEDDEIYFSDVAYQCQDGGFTVISINPETGDDFGYRYYVSSLGLLESANPISRSVETGDVVKFEYAVEPRWLDALEVLVDELLSSF